MIRPLTCVCMILAGCCGLYLYQVKHQAQVLDREINHTIDAVKAARERVRMLHAEWALLNEPERLQDLVGVHMPKLEPLVPAQFVQIADVGSRLSSMRANVTSTADETMDDRAEVEENAKPVAKATEPPIPRPQTAQPQHIARLATIMPPRLHEHEHEHEREEASIERHEPLMHPTLAPHPVPLAAPRPVSAGVLAAMAAPLRATPTMHPVNAPVNAYEPARPMPLAAPSLGGSALGMARTMLPPPAPVATYH